MSVMTKGVPKLLHDLEPFGYRHSLDLSTLKHAGTLIPCIGQSKLGQLVANDKLSRAESGAFDCNRDVIEALAPASG